MHSHLQKKMSRPARRSPTLLVSLFGVACPLALPPPASHAQGVGTEQQLGTVTVTGTALRSALDPNLPMTTASRSAEALREQQNLFNPEDALRNLPNTTVRKRYSGDRNALIAGRSFASSQAPRALVFMDGYLISNFLGRFDAPRWNMVSSEEMARVDQLYGPFSALYPGNSIGSTVVISTRKPQGFEGSVRVAGQQQRFSLFGQDGTFDNTQLSAVLGDRLEGGSWYRLVLNRQDATSQPMQYYTVSANASGQFTPPTTAGAATPVRGIVFDTGPNGRRRAVFGANAGAIDHTLQHTAKLSAGHDVAQAVSAEAFVAWWRNDTATRNSTLLRDAAGQPVWSGRVSQDGLVFDIPRAAFAPFSRDETHLQAGVTVKTRHGKGWNGSVVASSYRILGDLQRNAAAPDPVAAAGGAGTAVLRDGTGFRTLELQSTYTPQVGDWGDGRHALAFGLHANDYTLRQTTANLTDWRSAAVGAEAQFVGGKTRLFALYGQDAWRYAPDWLLTTGLRAESWQSMDGVHRITGVTPVSYPERRLQALSPKLSLAWEASPELTLRASAGRGVRFATVAELFQGTQSGSRIEQSDPALHPEVSNALELFAERRWGRGALRASLFQDDVRNTIWSQANPLTFPIVTTTQNVARVRTRGLELATDWQDLGLPGLGLDANIAFNRSVILDNPNVPTSVGKHWVRVPRVRSAVTVSYQPERAWTFAASYRYSGRQYNELDNSDVNPDVYGGTSRLSQLDLRVLWRAAARTELAFGLDNVNDDRAYQSHPFPGRTLFAELRQGF